MLLEPSLLLAASLAPIAAASPLHPRHNASTPCAQVSAAVAAQSGVAVPTVAARVAYECITSVPIKKDAALKLLDSIAVYFKWQSNTAWLKDPPKQYVEKVQPAVDIWAKYDEIKSKVEAGEYANEFEFGISLYTLGQSTHDGHFVYIPDSVGGIFNWARPVPLVSVSSDGKELPKPYVYSDILAESFANSSFKPSPISKINGEKATDYLEKWSQLGSLQDRDALYNNVFYELASVSLGPVGSGIGTFAGSGRGRWAYPGAVTHLEFYNGTTYKFENYAKVLVSFTGVTDGESLYESYFTIPTGTSTVAAANSTSPTPSTSASATATPIPAPGYPPPIFREENNLIGGYYLEDDYSDIAVLSVPSFVSLGSAEIPFQQTGEKFLAAAKAAGKKKLVIDLSANGGGTILQGYDLYKQLFPDGIGHAAADRFRAFESTDLLGQYFSRTSEKLPRAYFPEEQNETLWELESDVVSSMFNYQSDLDKDDKNFPSWPAKFGPVENHGDKFSSLFRWNLSDVIIPFNSGGIYIHGYGNLTNYTQPFAAEDIVVVTDGYCASTCTIFSELMRQVKGVKYVSLGGRAKEGITQAIGGVKGTNNNPWSYIQSLAQLTITELTNSTAEAASLNKTELGSYWDDTPFYRAAAGTSINVNFRDGIRDGDESETPLQFIYEPSDCRILYTKAMTVDATAIWKAVADSAFGGTSHCIAGDLGSTYGKRTAKELTVQERIYSRSLHQWRRDLSVKDFPLDVFTDLSGQDLDRHGIMWP
ncbi:hypothetical protein P280DRAFT_467392 [Massarina eburnea CBS 473.64]|uniref:Uncharacterized protein n=1 Tax=Massarina eburnea CBS 473.64 TaxID=1395130 RepID=A0A6A6S8S6_9PLEO|nr:hypothetical protein P280DRAFT_467392 [Massarina eburnea CBS 473.64]